MPEVNFFIERVMRMESFSNSDYDNNMKNLVSIDLSQFDSSIVSHLKKKCTMDVVLYYQLIYLIFKYQILLICKVCLRVILLYYQLI